MPVESHAINTLIPRESVTNAIDVLSMYGEPMDPRGTDWKERVSRYFSGIQSIDVVSLNDLHEPILQAIGCAGTSELKSSESSLHTNDIWSRVAIAVLYFDLHVTHYGEELSRDKALAYIVWAHTEVRHRSIEEPEIIADYVETRYRALLSEPGVDPRCFDGARWFLDDVADRDL